MSKLLERLAVVRLKSYHVPLLTGIFCRSAYSQGHSTETALCQILNDIIGSADAGHITALVRLDISAAFDVVDHMILIQRLHEEFRITDTCINCIMPYLADRSATVCVGSSSSPTVNVTYGVFQGSVLGPLLCKHGVCRSDRKTDP